MLAAVGSCALVCQLQLFLDKDSLATVIHALVISRFVQCNLCRVTLWPGLEDYSKMVDGETLSPAVLHSPVQDLFTPSEDAVGSSTE